MLAAIRFVSVATIAVLMTAQGALAQINIDVSLGATLPVVVDHGGNPVRVLVDFGQGVRRPYVRDRFGRRIYVGVVYDAWGRPLPMVYDIRTMGAPMLRERYLMAPRAFVVEHRVVRMKHKGHGRHKGHKVQVPGKWEEDKDSGPGKHHGRGKGS